MDRFWAKVDKNGPVPEYRPELGPCWIWLAARDPRGYGRFDQKPFGTSLAHRVAWLLDGGELDPLLTLDHLCRVRPCVRRSHLEQVTGPENSRRTPRELLGHMRSACAHGHPYTPETTRLDPAGARHCRVCDADNSARRSALRAAARIARFGFDPGPNSRKAFI